MFGELDPYTITETIRPFRGKTYIPPGPVTAILHFSYAGNTAVMFVKAMEALQVNPDLGGEMFFATDDTPPDTLLGNVKPFFDQCNVKLSSWHMPYWMIMFLIFVVYCGLYIIRLVKPVELANFPYTFGSIQFANTTFYVTYDKAKTLLGYKPLYDHETSIKRSKEFYLHNI